MYCFWLLALCPRLAVSAILVLVVTLVLGVTYVLSGRDPNVMITNVTIVLSALIVLVATIEVLKRRVRTCG